MAAVDHALTVLGWFELPEDDRPVERIWLDNEALTAHFDGVREKYRDPSKQNYEKVPMYEIEDDTVKGLRR